MLSKNWRKKKIIYKYNRKLYTSNNTKILRDKDIILIKNKTISNVSSFISILNYPRKSKYPCILKYDYYAIREKRNAICNFSMPRRSSIRVY